MTVLAAAASTTNNGNSALGFAAIALIVLWLINRKGSKGK